MDYLLYRPSRTPDIPVGSIVPSGKPNCWICNVSAYLAKGRWFRLISEPGTFALGGEIYYVDYRLAQSQIEITFDAADQHLVCCGADGELIKRVPLKGLSVENLMGSFLSQLNLPMFQLHLPLDWQSLRALRLFEILPATT